MKNSVQTTKKVFPVFEVDDKKVLPMLEVDEDTVKRLLKKDPFHPLSYIKEIKVENGDKEYLLKLFVFENCVMALEVMVVVVSDWPGIEPDDMYDFTSRCDYDLMQELLYIAVSNGRA